MRLPFSILALISASVAGCSTYEPTQADIAALNDVATPASNKAVMETAKAEMFNRLKFYDPYSVVVELREAKLGAKRTLKMLGYDDRSDGPTGGWFICGTYNAKNRLGGYVGEDWFSVLLDPQNPERAVSFNTFNVCNRIEYENQRLDLTVEDFSAITTD